MLLSFMLAVPFAINASAQTNRAYVASSGDDLNQCTTASPCRTINHALDVVDAGGEVIIIENGEYDSFNMLKSATVAATPGVNAIVISDSQTIVGAINVLTASDTVRLRNLHFKKVGDNTNSIGINNHAGTIFIEDCTITGYQTGVLTSNAAGAVFIRNTTVRHNLFGITLIGAQSEGTLRVLIDDCKIEYNDTGVSVSTRVIATIRDTKIANNSSRGVSIRPIISSQRAEALLDNCLITHNTTGVGVGGNPGGPAIVRLTRSTISNNFLNGVLISTGGTAYTLQNNTIVGNLPDVNGALLTPVNLK